MAAPQPLGRSQAAQRTELIEWHNLQPSSEIKAQAALHKIDGQTFQLTLIVLPSTRVTYYYSATRPSRPASWDVQPAPTPENRFVFGLNVCLGWDVVINICHPTASSVPRATEASAPPHLYTQTTQSHHQGLYHNHAQTVPDYTASSHPQVQQAPGPQPTGQPLNQPTFAPRGIPANDVRPSTPVHHSQQQVGAHPRNNSNLEFSAKTSSSSSSGSPLHPSTTSRVTKSQHRHSSSPKSKPSPSKLSSTQIRQAEDYAQHLLNQGGAPAPQPSSAIDLTTSPPPQHAEAPQAVVESPEPPQDDQTGPIMDVFGTSMLDDVNDTNGNDFDDLGNSLDPRPSSPTNTSADMFELFGEYE